MVLDQLDEIKHTQPELYRWSDRILIREEYIADCA